MKNILLPGVSWSLLQNNNHQAVKKMEWVENRKYDKIPTKNRYDFIYVWFVSVWVDASVWVYLYEL